MCAAIACMAAKLDFCFTEVPLTMDVVEKLLASDPPSEDQIQQIRGLREHKVAKGLQILLPVGGYLLLSYVILKFCNSRIF